MDKYAPMALAAGILSMWYVAFGSHREKKPHEEHADSD